VNQSKIFWQCVLVAWGEKYPAAEINLLAKSIGDAAHGLQRIILITDRERPGLSEGIICTRFPDYFLQSQFTNRSCLAKLAMFEKGVIPEDFPAIYCDLDTLVLKDLSPLLTLLRSSETIALLPASIISFGWFSTLIHKWTKGRVHARGNSSILVFNPKSCHHIAREFRTLYDAKTAKRFRPFGADDRFLSWFAQDTLRLIPNSLCVKLPTEYMQFWPWLIHLRARLPWIRRRRDALLAVTLPGMSVKGSDLLALQYGHILTDRRGRKLIWSDEALGSLRGKLIAYYRQLHQS
jgi:hypothetical protein